jgi:hypothetical protein
MKSSIFWDTMLCSAVKVKHFGGTCRLHLQARRMSQARNRRESRCQAEGVLFDIEDGCGMFLRNAGWISTDYSSYCLHLHGWRCEVSSWVDYVGRMLCMWSVRPMGGVKEWSPIRTNGSIGEKTALHQPWRWSQRSLNVSSRLQHCTMSQPKRHISPVVYVYRTTRCHNPEHHNLNSHRSENLRTRFST